MSKLTIVFYALCIWVTFSTCDGCTFSEKIDGKCIRLFNRSVTWEDAQAACEAEGPGVTLVKLTSETVRKYIQNKTKNLGSRAWLGASDVAQEGRWVWSSTGDVANIDPSWWGKNQPDNSGGNEDCLIMRPDGLLNDAPCRWELPYFCESVDVDAAVPTTCTQTSTTTRPTTTTSTTTRPTTTRPTTTTPTTTRPTTTTPTTTTPTTTRPTTTTPTTTRPTTTTPTTMTPTTTRPTTTTPTTTRPTTTTPTTTTPTTTTPTTTRPTTTTPTTTRPTTTTPTTTKTTTPTTTRSTATTTPTTTTPMRTTTCAYIMVDSPDTTGNTADYDLGCSLLTTAQACKQACLNNPSCTTAEIRVSLVQCCLASGTVTTTPTAQVLGLTVFTVSRKQCPSASTPPPITATKTTTTTQMETTTCAYILVDSPNTVGNAADYDMGCSLLNTPEACKQSCLNNPACTAVEIRIALVQCCMASGTVTTSPSPPLLGLTLYTVSRKQCPATTPARPPTSTTTPPTSTTTPLTSTRTPPPTTTCAYAMVDVPNVRGSGTNYDLGCSLLNTANACKQSCLTNPACKAAEIRAGLVQCCLTSENIVTQPSPPLLGLTLYTVSYKQCPQSITKRPIGDIVSNTAPVAMATTVVTTTTANLAPTTATAAPTTPTRVTTTAPATTTCAYIMVDEEDATADDFNDYDLGCSLIYLSQDACRDACLNNPKCMAAEYSFLQCCFASGTVPSTYSSGDTVFRKVCPAPATAPCPSKMVDYPNQTGNSFAKSAPGNDLEDCKQQCLNDPTCVATEFSDTFYYYYYYYDQPTCLIATGPISTSASTFSTVSRKQCI